MKNNNRVLSLVEIFVFGGIVFGLISPLFSPEEEKDSHHSSLRSATQWVHFF